MSAGNRVPPTYPAYTGQEPCAEIGVELYYLPEDTPHSKVEARVAEKACNLCPLLAECLEWALHRERWGYWAGTTAYQRVQMRRNLGIRVVEPQYEQWLPFWERREEGSDEPAA